MTLRDALDFALTSLRGNLAKSLLTVLGLGVGVGAVLTVLSLGDAGEIRVEEEIARLGVDKVWFCAENPAYPLTEDCALSLLPRARMFALAHRRWTRCRSAGKPSMRKLPDMTMA